MLDNGQVFGTTFLVRPSAAANSETIVLNGSSGTARAVRYEGAQAAMWCDTGDFFGQRLSLRPANSTDVITLNGSTGLVYAREFWAGPPNAAAVNAAMWADGSIFGSVVRVRGPAPTFVERFTLNGTSGLVAVRNANGNDSIVLNATSISGGRLSLRTNRPGDGVVLDAGSGTLSILDVNSTLDRFSVVTQPSAILRLHSNVNGNTRAALTADNSTNAGILRLYDSATTERVTLDGSTGTLKLGANIELNGATSVVRIGSITIDGNTGKITVGTGPNQVVIDASNGLISSPNFQTNSCSS